jgi:hypothetical protein
MAEPTDKPEPNFLRRWSQRKLAAAREAEDKPVAPAAVPAQPPAAPPAIDPQRVQAGDPEAPKLPDIDSLTFDSDFKAFLAPEVDEGTRRAALRKLYADPHFNTMDGLDVYIDDYSKFEPVTPEVLKQLVHARYLFDPPKTRVNEQGYGEDVPEVQPAAAEAQPADPAQADASAVALSAASPATPAATAVADGVPADPLPGVPAPTR